MRDFVRERSRTGLRVSLVESGIDLADFLPTARASGPFVLGYVGRMSPEKNPLGFIFIAERLHAALPQLQFAIFGEGGMEKQVRARAAASPAANAIRFEGYAPHARDAFASIDVLVVPSKVDGRPNAIMEANATGVPVIGAPVGGIPELIEDGVNGLVAAPDDHARILSTVAGWVNDPEGFQRLRRSCRVKAEQQYDRKRMLDDYEAVFRSALAGAGGDA
jgi:glycosyltransferase involved in cell wall biosynthesis